MLIKYEYIFYHPKYSHFFPLLLYLAPDCSSALVICKWNLQCQAYFSIFTYFHWRQVLLLPMYIISEMLPWPVSFFFFLIVFMCWLLKQRHRLKPMCPVHISFIPEPSQAIFSRSILFTLINPDHIQNVG